MQEVFCTIYRLSSCFGKCVSYLSGSPLEKILQDVLDLQNVTLNLISKLPTKESEYTSMRKYNLYKYNLYLITATETVYYNRNQILVLRRLISIYIYFSVCV